MAAKTILVIDDDRDLLLGLSVRLKAEGYEVITAADAVAATGAARKGDPDVIILDLGLPGGDGYLVMQRLRSMLVSLAPIIVLTARDPATDECRATQLGAFTYLQKPVSNDRLLRAIRRALNEPVEPEKDRLSLIPG